MLLLCETSVVDRRHNKSAPIPCPSQITLIDEVVELQKHLYLKVIRTENGRRTEEQYELLNNVTKLDTQFVKDNILMISLRNPKYNIFVKSDKAQLNFFVKTLRGACTTRMGGNALRPPKFVPKGARAHFRLSGPAPVSQTPTPIGGIGLKLLKNMGWNPGEGLGKDKTGATEPLLLEQKNDKMGLYTSGENLSHLVKGQQPRKPKVEVTFEGKHPVSQLSELAARNKWHTPDYEFSLLKDSADINADKKFFFRVTLNGTKYESTVDAVKKKDAKLFAAQYVLQELGELNVEPAVAEPSKSN